MNTVTRKLPSRLSALLFCYVAGAFCAAAQATESDDGLWTVFTNTDSFPSADEASRWHYWLDAQARYFDIGSGINQYLLRPGIGYDVGDNMNQFIWVNNGENRMNHPGVLNFKMKL